MAWPSIEVPFQNLGGHVWAIHTTDKRYEIISSKAGPSRSVLVDDGPGLTKPQIDCLTVLIGNVVANDQFEVILRIKAVPNSFQAKGTTAKQKILDCREWDISVTGPFVKILE